MQPIIRRTLTITVTETWTITWADGPETVWHATQAVGLPAVNEPDELLAPLTDNEEGNDDTPDSDAAESTAENE